MSNRKSCTIDRVLHELMVDRKRRAKLGVLDSFIKRTGFDLFIKYGIVLFNSIGTKESNALVFVDEVNNSNMFKNLHATKSDLDKHEETRTLSLRKVCRSKHIRIGILWPVIQLFQTVFAGAAFAVVLSIRKENSKYEYSMLRYLTNAFSNFLNKLDAQAKLYLLMSDHHFFSSIVALQYPEKSCVLQHGLIQDKAFFEPIRADYFFAWGKASSNLIGDKRKVFITGTNKFDECLRVQRSAIKSPPKKVLVCLATSRSKEAIEHTLKPIFELQNRLKFDLLIKTHPGSQFSMDELIEAAQGRIVNLYKDEAIADLDFDFAISEQSTSLLDFACMNVPFILFDEVDDSYFRLNDAVPTAHDAKDIEKVLRDFDQEAFVAMKKRFLENELNGGVNTIYEKIEEILRASQNTNDNI